MSIAVLAADEEHEVQQRAATLAASLHLPLLGRADTACDLLLCVTRERLELRLTGRRAPGPVYADLVGGPGGFRRVSGSGRRQLIARAVGIKGTPPAVLDATAGLGRDAFLLACLGCRVMAVERSAVVLALVQDAVDRARRMPDPKLHTVLDRLRLVHADAREWLTRMSPDEAPDVVYLDPMYPARKRASVASSKELTVLRLVVGDDPDAAELLAVARRMARHRVVVKRPRLAAPLAEQPDVVFRGKMVRYDAYLTKRVQ